MFYIKRLISKKDEAQIHRASTPSEKAALVLAAVIKSSPKEFQDFLSAIKKASLSLSGDFVETIQYRYRKRNTVILISDFSSADPDTIAAVLSVKRIISREDEAQISLASTLSEKAALVLAAIIKCSPKEFQNLLNAIKNADLLLPGDFVETMQSCHHLRTKLILAFLDNLNTITTMLSIKGIISKEDETQINLAPAPSEKATILLTTVENQM